MLFLKVMILFLVKEQFIIIKLIEFLIFTFAILVQVLVDQNDLNLQVYFYFIIVTNYSYSILQAI